MQDFPSRGSTRQEFLDSHAASGRTGTIILGDGSRTGLIFVPGGLVAQIAKQAASHARGALSHEKEVGGLLIGPKPDGNDLLIEEAVPIDVEYSFSPSLPLSFAAFDRVKAAIAAAQRDDAKTILGLYRVRAASDGDLSQADFEVLDAIRASHTSLLNIRSCLVIEAAVHPELQLRILIHNGTAWENNQQITLNLESEGAGTDLDAVPAAPISLERAKPASPSEPAFGAVGSPIQANSRTLNSPVAGRSLRTATVLFIAGVLLASAAVVFRWVDLRRSSADATRQDSPAALRTGFSANPDGSSWKLTWNSAAVLAMNPTGATLFIQDGGDEQDVPLTMADLSGGTIYYSAKSGELAFRLQVRRNGASVAEERVRVLDKIKSIARTPQQTQLSNDSTYLLPGSQRMAGRAQFEASSASENPATPSEADRRLSATATRKFIPPKSVSAPPPSNPILGAAGPISATALPVSPAVSTSFAAPPPPPAATAAPPPPAATIAASPAAPATSQPQSVSPVVPVAGTPPQYNFQAPRPVKQVQPVAPPDARAAGGTQITVVVSIDAKGKVLKATPTGRVEDFYLFGVAIRAARLWEFEPARLNGKAVPSEISLIFRF